MKYAIVLGCLVGGFSLADGAAVNIGGVLSASMGLVLTSADGVPLSAGGYYIAVGSFAVAPPISGGTVDASPYVNQMDIFATATSPTFANNTQGTIVGQFIGLGGANPALFNGKQIYVVVGNGASQATSTGFAILTTATNVVFPADVTTNATTTISFSNINNSVVVAGAVEVAVDPPGKDQIRLIPEPSAAMLGALGALGLLRRRRG